MKTYKHNYIEQNDGRQNKTTVIFEFNEDKEVAVHLQNKEITNDNKQITFARIELEKDGGFALSKLNSELVPFIKNYDSLISFIKFRVEDYYNIRDLHFPRIYMNLARALSDSNMWVYLEESFNNETDQEKIEVTQYTMISLFTSTAIFSYAAIESYANFMLTKSLGVERFNQIDSDINTKALKEKLKVLCTELGITNKIQDSTVWNDFIILDKIRNSLIHYKQDNLYDLVYDHSTKIIPAFLLQTSINVIKFYYDALDTPINKYLEGNMFWFEGINLVG